MKQTCYVCGKEDDGKRNGHKFVKVRIIDDE